MTWNPVTGCLHGCQYCYAERIAKRFCTNEHGKEGLLSPCSGDCKACSEMDGLEFVGDMVRDSHGSGGFPFGFLPTIHRNRLEEPQLMKKPQNVFVCSMADLFGDWVSYEWLDKVFDVCKGASQHRFLFLTKNPKRYMELHNVLPKGNNFFFGTTITTEDMEYWYSDSHNWFLSIEPIMGKFSCKGIFGQKPFWEGPGIKPKWVIVGAETGNRRGKVIPKKEWVEAIVNECRNNKIPVFLKNNLAPVWGGSLIQEYPWEKG
jgi:protein gp37